MSIDFEKDEEKIFEKIGWCVAQALKYARNDEFLTTQDLMTYWSGLKKGQVGQVTWVRSLTDQVHGDSRDSLLRELREDKNGDPLMSAQST